MLAKPPLMDGLVVNVHRGLGQEAIETIGNTKLDRRGFAVFGTAGTPKVQSCSLCLEPSHLRNYRGHWDALDAHRPHHGVVNIHKDNLLGHRCLTFDMRGRRPACRAPSSRWKGWASLRYGWRTFFRTLFLHEVLWAVHRNNLKRIGGALFAAEECSRSVPCL